MSATPEQLAATSRRITAGIWACAAITMTASLINGTAVFDALTLGSLPVVVGLLTALAVDASLVVVLVGDARMQSEGLTARWGRVARIVTAGFSLALNCGASLALHHYFLAFLHAACPILIIILAEYGQEVNLEFARKIRAAADAILAAEIAEQNQRRALADEETRQRQAAANRRAEEAAAVQHQHELASAAANAAAAAAQEAAALERLNEARRAATETVNAALASKPDLHVLDAEGKPRPRRTAATRRAPAGGKREAALAYIAREYASGRPLKSIGSAEINRAIGASGYIKGALLAELRKVTLDASSKAGASA